MYKRKKRFAITDLSMEWCLTWMEVCLLGVENHTRSYRTLKQVSL